MLRLDEEQFLNELYNLILNKNVVGRERALYSEAKKSIEIDKEYYEGIIFQLSRELATLGVENKLSKEGTKFMMEITKFIP